MKGPIVHPERCTDNSIATGDHAHVTTQKVDISERTLSIIAFGLSVAALVTSLWSMHEAELRHAHDIEQRQAQISTDYREIDRLVHEVNVRNITLENHDAMMIRAGIKQPGDQARGPTGNLEFHPYLVQEKK